MLTQEFRDLKIDAPTLQRQQKVLKHHRSDGTVDEAEARTSLQVDDPSFDFSLKDFLRVLSRSMQCQEPGALAREMASSTLCSLAARPQPAPSPRHRAPPVLRNTLTGAQRCRDHELVGQRLTCALRLPSASAVSSAQTRKLLWPCSTEDSTALSC